MDKTFAEFKKEFYNKFDDPKIFDCGDFNTLKIVLDGLKVNYSQYKIAETYFYFPWWFYCIIRFIKRNFIWRWKFYKGHKMVKEKLNDFQHKKYFVGDAQRTITGENGIEQSLYYSRIITDLGSENCLFVVNQISRNNTFPTIDLLYNEVFYYALFFDFSSYHKILRDDLIQTFNTIKVAGRFSKIELFNIKVAFDIFFQNFLAWDFLFKHLKLEAIIVTVHYHREGMIYAAKKNNLKVVELQHGLIAAEDIFYNFPQKVKSIMHKSLFANNIMVYGNAWRDRLLKGVEYTQNQISVLGYYHYINNDISNQQKLFLDLISTKKIALFTTQTFLEPFFISYLNSVYDNIPNDFIVVIKPHPSEKMELYQESFKNKDKIKIVNFNLDFVLSMAAFNVTCYSTTVFDAMRFNKKSFAINFEKCADYVNSLVMENLVVKVEPHENLFVKIEELEKVKIDSSYWYSPYDINTLRAVLPKN